jgi:ATP:corrinoid adenosyltransferase
MTEAEIPREHQRPARRRAESVVVVVQFLKSGKWRVGEEKMQKVKHAHATGVLAKKGIDH